jgi:hypothetical protein
MQRYMITRERSISNRRVLLAGLAILMANDDGYLGAAAIIGSVHRPTDFAPQGGHLTLANPAQAVAARASGEAVQPRFHLAKAWGAH